VKAGPASTFLGIDLGASSGRAVVGQLRGGRLTIEEIHRFPNSACELGGTLYWNFLSLWGQVQESLRRCGLAGHAKLDGIGVNTWGVDFGLLGSDGRLLDNPVCHRDAAMEGMGDIIASRIDKEQFYQVTGLAPGPVGTLAQLCVRTRRGSADPLRLAETLLTMPDLIRYFLCGHKAIELSSAGGTMLANVRTAKWSPKVFRTMGVPLRIMPEIIRPATAVGKLHADLAKQAGLNQVPVIAVAGHDTLSAAAAAPHVADDCALISCGTWSVFGTMREKPITTPEALSRGFVNEPGVDSMLLCKNMMGLYLFENLRRSLARDGSKVSYAQMIREASAAKPFAAVLNLNAPLFFVSRDPAESVGEFLHQTGQKSVRGRDSVARLLLEGLAWTHRQAAEDLQALTGTTLKRICLIGGGSRNTLLCQMMADATALEVIAVPAEATMAGNLGVQALATGRLRTPDEIREVVRQSFKLRTYKPQTPDLWNRHQERYRHIVTHYAG